jgi:hypothetical protein
MSNAVHDRIKLANDDNYDKFREALVIVGIKPCDDVSLDLSSLGLRFSITLTRTQALALGRLLVRAGEP